MNRMTKRAWACVSVPFLVTTLAVGISACGSDDDYDSPTYDPDETVINMGYGFNDVAFTCNGTTGLYVAGDDGGIAALPLDPKCQPA